MMQFWFLLTVDIRPFSERAVEAGTVALLGMGAIFGVLALLWGAIELFHVCVSAVEKGKTKKQTVIEQTASPVPAKVPAETPDDGALIAAMTAAISAMRAEEGNTTGFRVVSFRRSH